MTKIKLGLAQINSVMGDFSANLEKILGYLEQARSAGAAWVIFPEMALCGYPPEDLLLQPAFLKANRLALRKVAAAAGSMAVVIGFADQTSTGIYNAAAILHQHRLLAVYHKRELPNYGVFDEKRYFIPGTAPLWVDQGPLRFGVTICEDIWIPGNSVEQDLSEQGVDLIVNLSASPFHAGKIHRRRKLFAGLARRTHSQLVHVNLVGGQDELVFDGGSMILDARGILKASSRLFQEELLLADLELTPKSRRAGKKQRGIPVLPWPPPALQAHPPLRHSLPGQIEEIHSALVLGTRDYVRKNGFKKVVIGLSGGVDSTLTAAIAVEALGAENVIGVTMPSVYTSDATLLDARRTAGNLGISLQVLPIQALFQSYQETLKEVMPSDGAGLAFENIQARIRGNLLMALSNAYGWLVLTTGNKSETAVGYCTLYGDMAGGFAVIKDVPKTMVYQLAEYINQKQGRETILVSIIERAPSAELRPNQRDQDTLPPYEILDQILKYYVENDMEPRRIKLPGVDPGIVRETVKKINQSEYKRRQAAPGIKITPKAFGRDRRLPITNRFKNGI